MVTQRDGLPACAPAPGRRAARPGPGRLAARVGVVGFTLLLAGACTTRPSAPLPPPPKPIPQVSTAQPGSGPATRVPAGARSFEIDPGRSSVTILVNRAGPFARFAHNHVVTSGQESGFAWEGREPAGSGFEVHVPVASLVVDDPAARAAAGGEFAGEVPESAREGTYRNMTRPEVLDVAEYPEVIIRCNGLAGTWERPVASADLTIRGVTRRVDIPIGLERSGDMLLARGSFSIRQSDFGITPFSVAGGAIQVGDELGLSFEIVAVAR